MSRHQLRARAVRRAVFRGQNKRRGNAVGLTSISIEGRFLVQRSAGRKLALLIGVCLAYSAVAV